MILLVVETFLSLRLPSKTCFTVRYPQMTKTRWLLSVSIVILLVASSAFATGTTTLQTSTQKIVAPANLASAHVSVPTPFTVVSGASGSASAYRTVDLLDIVEFTPHQFISTVWTTSTIVRDLQQASTIPAWMQKMHFSARPARAFSPGELYRQTPQAIAVTYTFTARR